MQKKQAAEWHHFYYTSVWQRRRKNQLVQQPLCEKCRKAGRVTAARVVHHIEPHKGSWELFCNSPLESLCEVCHNQHTASVERSGLPVKRVGLDGWPVYE